ncbi:MAG: hypothetical protein GY769_21850 [bacterium]|nr:hypothetical protein [bacterium]
MREMAYTFAEEFAALGFGRDRLLELFRRPGYAGAHRAYLALGEDEIGRIINESLSLWGRFQIVVEDPTRVPRGEVRARPPEELVQLGSPSAAEAGDKD